MWAKPILIYSFLKVELIRQVILPKMINILYKWEKVFKNGPSKIFGRQSLKILKWYGLLRQSSTNFTWFILEYLVSNILRRKYYWPAVLLTSWAMALVVLGKSVFIGIKWCLLRSHFSHQFSSKVLWDRYQFENVFVKLKVLIFLSSRCINFSYLVGRTEYN